ncbi:MAG: DegT/DnrJ/EryC1/StrS family aminotransferase [Bacteroidia bacterium]
MNIQMVDLKSQYARLKTELDEALLDVVRSTAYIKGPHLRQFEENLAKYLGVKHVIGVANGTDALQIALMALGLEKGDEVIVPAFTYVATAEVIGLLGLKPVMVDVDIETFNINTHELRNAITSKTRVIIPVHLFGQPSDMTEIMKIAAEFDVKVIEDNAQAIGSDFYSSNGESQKTGTIGEIGCTSFFPSKNLGCFGDGGAIFTNSDELAADIRMIANHGQRKKYYHSVLGVNSRLDTIQAAVLDVKLNHLDDFAERRRDVARRYTRAFKELDWLTVPIESDFGNHVYHQYTLKVKEGKRDKLKLFLNENGIPSMIYYPVPLYKQEAYKDYHKCPLLPVTEDLCQTVLSLPIHTEMEDNLQDFIIDKVIEFENE